MTKNRVIFVVLFIFALCALLVGGEIHQAAQKGDLDKAKMLLENDPQLVNARDEADRTPLHWAARGVHLEMLKLLIEKGADVNARDRFTITPVHIVAFNGNIEIIQLLAEKGADLNAKTTASLTPLYFTQFNNKTEAVELLLSLGADQNLQKFTELTGKYFGQNKPRKTPEPFATGIISSLTSLQNAPVLSPDGKEVYWSVFWGSPFRIIILFMKMENNRWTVPQIAPFSDEFYYFNPVFSPDGKRLYFISNRSAGECGGLDQVFDIYISFRQKDGSWTPARKMDNGINSDKFENTPMVSPDGKYLFFLSQRNGGIGEVFWMDAKIIDEHKK